MATPVEQKAAVEAFLQRWRKACDHFQVDFIQRKKNRVGLVALSLNLKLAKQLLKELTLSDYVSGPEPDRDHPGEIWVFGVKLNEQHAYIKIKLYTVGKQERPKCISFHPAEYTINYPFAGGNYE